MLPTGYDRAGMQIAGRPFDEGCVLALDHAYELAVAGSRRRPVVSPAIPVQDLVAAE